MTDNSNEHDGSATLDRGMDALGGMAATAKAAIGGGSTASFVNSATIAAMYEIKAAEIALQRSRSDNIRQIAQRMIDDHQPNLEKFKSIVSQSEPALQPASELDTLHEKMIEHLRDAQEGDFDKTYLDQQRLAHREAITLYDSYSSRGDDAQLKNYAEQTLPVLREHQRIVDQANA